MKEVRKNLFVIDLMQDSMLQKEVIEYFFIRKVTKEVNGTVKLAVTLADKTGELRGTIWNEHIQETHYKMENTFCRISASVGMYKGLYTLNITNMEPVHPELVSYSDFCSSIDNIDELYGSFVETYHSDIQKTHLVELLDKFFMNEVISKKFKDLQGGTKVHHVQMGGCLMHTMSVYNNCKLLARNYLSQNLYSELDMDILLTAACIHDIGKIKEYKPFPFNQRTDEGILIGHLVLGICMVYKALSDIKTFPKQEEIKLIHLLSTSHGEMDKIIKPATVEALILNRSDELDARVDGFNQILLNDSEVGNITRFNPILDQYIYKK
ncbi:MAG: HD domain-containing protein [Clostridia bacterium]